jgi:hypothetical protein
MEFITISTKTGIKDYNDITDNIFLLSFQELWKQMSGRHGETGVTK